MRISTNTKLFGFYAVFLLLGAPPTLLIRKYFNPSKEYEPNYAVVTIFFFVASIIHYFLVTEKKDSKRTLIKNPNLAIYTTIYIVISLIVFMTVGTKIKEDKYLFIT